MRLSNKWVYSILLSASVFAGAYGSQALAAAPIDMPLNTWVARALPEDPGTSPWGEMKHMRIAHNPVNGRLYFNGGDFTGASGLNNAGSAYATDGSFFASGRNEIYSYSIEGGDWSQEQEYCRGDGGYYPAGPDQTGWVYDSIRKQFWMIPGYTTDGALANCTTTKMLKGTMMAFDPVAKTWNHNPATPFTLPDVTSSSRKFAQYDPFTDTIIRFSAGSRVEIYDIAKNTWSSESLLGGISSENTGFEYTALDVEGRAIYMVPVKTTVAKNLTGRIEKLIRYNIDTQTAEYLADLPLIVGKENIYTVWDSLNKVVLMTVYGSKNAIEIYVYHPDTKPGCCASRSASEFCYCRYPRSY